MYTVGILWIFQQRDIKLDTREKKRGTREEIHGNINLSNRKKNISYRELEYFVLSKTAGSNFLLWNSCKRAMIFSYKICNTAYRRILKQGTFFFHIIDVITVL